MPYQIPFPNLLSNQLHATGSTIDLMIAEPDLFVNLKLPDGLNRDTVIDTIVERHGMTTLVHPDPDWMKYFIGVWSARRVIGWRKLYETTVVEYNPIENYDRKEDVTDTRTTDTASRDVMKGTTTGSSTGKQKGKTDTSVSEENENDSTTTNSQDTTRESENKGDVSAENAEDYQSDSRTTENGKENVNGTTTVSALGSSSQDSNQTTESETSNTSNGTSEQTSNGTVNTSETYTHTNRTHGNIGVVTTQQMLESERELVRYSLIEEIADDYCDAFCLAVY